MQESLQALIAPMVRSLGPTHPQFNELIEKSPVGSEALVLRLLTIVAEKVTLSPEIVESVKTLGRERGAINPKFYLAIIAGCNKVSREAIKFFRRQLMDWIGPLFTGRDPRISTEDYFVIGQYACQ